QPRRTLFPYTTLFRSNSDNFMSATLEQSLDSLTAALNEPDIAPRLLQKTVLDVVELYPYIEYMKYLLPGSITLAMFVSVMIGGGDRKSTRLNSSHVSI